MRFIIVIALLLVLVVLVVLILRPSAPRITTIEHRRDDVDNDEDRD